MILRDYQVECVQRIMEAYEKDPSGTELVVWPTGSGKTVLFSETIRLFSLQGKAAIVLAHRDELLNQASDKYRAIKPDAVIGKVGSGAHEYGGEVTVASVQTISRPYHLKQLKNFHYGLVIVDEAHHSAANGYQAVLKELQGAFILMVTATPDRLDGKPILDKEPLHQRNIIDMIQEGYLCNVKAIAIRTHVSLDSVGTRMGDFAEKELELAIDTPSRNKRVLEAYLEHAQGRRTACFAVTVNHANSLCYTFNDAGIAAGVISGDTPLVERKRLYDAFHAGEILVLVSVNVLSEGWDEPLCSCIIMARPTKSRSLYVQAIGRGLRLAEGKENCVILDLTDNVLKHRLTPQTLGKAIGMEEIRDGETVEEAVERIKAEKEAIVRKLKEKREKDLEIELLNKLEWEQWGGGKVNGVRTIPHFLLVFGKELHRLKLVPQIAYTDPGYDEDDLGGEEYVVGYKVEAWLADHRKQMWTGTLPLAEAQQFAEREARKLLAGAAPILIDRSAPWRARPATESQINTMDKLHIGYQWGITSGEASDLLDQAFARKREKKKVLA